MTRMEMCGKHPVILYGKEGVKGKGMVRDKSEERIDEKKRRNREEVFYVREGESTKYNLKRFYSTRNKSEGRNVVETGETVF